MTHSPSSSSSSEAERDAFEAWATKRGNRLEKFGSALGIWSYEDDETQAAFVAWQARAARATPPSLPIDFKQASEQGGWRTVKACYYPSQTLELHEDHDLDEDNDGFAPEGWYEETETHEVTLPLEFDPARWMPLPAAPTLQGVADGDAVGGKSGGDA